MTGRIALRALDPVDGYERVDGFATAMHLTIDIPNVAAFIAGSSREADMRADVVIPVLGGRFVTENGKFVLFESGQGPNGTTVQQMLYTADLINDDRQFKMTARKVLEPRGGRIWRVWGDTTRLRVTLVDVTPDDDKQRPRRAAGVISITLWEFVRQMTRMRGYGDGGLFTRWRAVGAYVAFFVRGLWRIYVRKELIQNE
ncbi:MAG: hypothetical protein WBB00_28750 [Mycobacterium sp.]